MAIETSNISIDSSISAELEKLQPMIEGYLNLMHGFYQSGLGKEEFFELARSELDDFDAKLDTISAKLEQEHGRLIVISDASLVDYVRGRFKFHPAIIKRG